MAGTTIAAFWMVSFLLVITPGADWAYAITAGLRHRTVLPAVGGLLAGHLLATAVVAAGVAALVARSALVMTVLTTGAAYLVWLGAGMLARPSIVHAGTESDSRSHWQQAIKGLGVSGLNPKVFLLFLALLPQFTRPSTGWPAWVQIAVLGSVQVASCAVIYLAVGAGARKVLRTRPAAARTVARISGVAMMVIGVALLVEQLVK